MKSKKGGQFEREFSKLLSLWYTENERDDVFWRTSGSGARATTRRKQQKRTKYEYGDISFRDPIGLPFIDYFLLELKRGYTKDIDVLSLLDGQKGKSILLRWWDKAVEEMSFAKRKAVLLVIRRNNKKECIVISAYTFRTFKNLGFNGEFIRIKSKKTHLIIIPLENFFQQIPIKKFKILLMRNNDDKECNG